MRQIKINWLQLLINYITIYTLPYMVKITQPGCSKNNFKSIRNEYKETFSSKKHFYLSL